MINKLRQILAIVRDALAIMIMVALIVLGLVLLGSVHQWTQDVANAAAVL